MKWEWPTLLVSSTLLGLTYFVPPYVWGDDNRTKRQLLRMVPLGSSLAELRAAAQRSRWVIDERNIHSSQAGSETYMHDHNRECRTRGGLVVPIVIALYNAPFETVVESQWMFDHDDKLRDICVRTAVDSL